MSSRSFRNDNVLTAEEVAACLSRGGERAATDHSVALRVRDVERIDRVLVGEGAGLVEVILGLYGDTDKALTSSGALISAVREKYADRPFQRFNYGRTVVLAVGDSARAEAVLQLLREEAAR